MCMVYCGFLKKYRLLYLFYGPSTSTPMFETFWFDAKLLHPLLEEMLVHIHLFLLDPFKLYVECKSLGSSVGK